jgi:protein-tyrosine phosphatase
MSRAGPTVRGVNVTLSDRDFQRLVPFEGCFNFRDLGGYDSIDGSTVRPGRMYRADGPHSLTGADSERLNALGLATVIDLRTHAEGDLHGRYSDRVVGVSEYHLPLTEDLPNDDALASWSDPGALGAYYWELLSSGHDSICEALALLTDPSSYPVLMHCSAGKDRTGVLSAIVLGMVGVPDGSIVDDYVLSGPAMAKLVEHLQRAYPDGQERINRLIPTMTAAHPAAMQWFLGNVASEHASFPGYIEYLGMETAVPYVRACVLAP